MARENVEAFKRFIAAFNRRDVEAILEDVDPGVEWRPASAVALGGEATVYRGHAGVPDALRDLYGSFAELEIEISNYHEAGDTVVGTGRIRTRGKESGAEVVSPFGAVFRCRNAKATEIRSYLDPQEAREAAGLSE
ncbi:MAG: nuclear transport factor 2 family protein [Chloroflexi bacterium]|nr:nuclear transport factor 2 family protein [Chloroflexota bacterium]